MLLSRTFRHNVRSSFGKRGDDCSTASRGDVQKLHWSKFSKKRQHPKKSTLCWSSDVAHGVGWVCESRMKS